MCKFLYLTKNRIKKKKRQPKSMKRFNLKSINIFLGVCILVVSIIYLIQTNSLATKGYEIKELEKEIIELKQATKNLEAQALEMQSVKKVSEKVNSLNMVLGEEVEYLSGDQKEVALSH